jgi:hypothetical protein
VHRRRDSILILFALLFAAVAGAQSVSDVPSARVGTQAGGMHVDGVLDEAAWNTAEPLSTFTMIEPSEDKAPTSATIVRVLVSATEILIGIVCADQNPDEIVSFTKQRDGVLRNEDNVKIVIDTFFDGRSGYVFQINPGGARYDALINPGGDSENANWDGI